MPATAISRLLTVVAVPTAVADPPFDLLVDP